MSSSKNEVVGHLSGIFAHLMSHGRKTMRNLSIISTRILQIFFLCLICQSISCGATEKIFNVAVAFSAHEKYDRSTQQIINGIYAAKLFFEKLHPKYKVNYINYNYRSHDLKSVAKVAEQICINRIPVVIGGEMSEDALVLGQILNSCHSVLISPTATNPIVSENKPYVFRISASDDDVAKK